MRKASKKKMLHASSDMLDDFHVHLVVRRRIIKGDLGKRIQVRAQDIRHLFKHTLGIIRVIAEILDLRRNMLFRLHTVCQSTDNSVFLLQFLTP